MKIGRTICAVLMVILCGIGWVTQASNLLAVKNEYAQAISAAQSYAANGLYQKAIQSYTSALSIREDADIRMALVETYEEAYADGVATKAAYQSALETACDLYPKQAEYWERLLRQLCNSGSYNDAYKQLSKAKRAGAESEALDALEIEITYSYSTSGSAYSEIYRSPNGYVVVCSGDGGWGVVAPNGGQAYSCNYRYISPYSDAGTAVFRTDSGTRLLDFSKVVQAILTEDISAARAYGDGLLPVYSDGQWRYFFCAGGEYLLDRYDDVSSFQNGIAAVQQEGMWSLIDTNGGRLSEASFDDVKLYGNGDYCYNDLMVASDGTYGLYHADGTRANDFSAQDMDLYMGGYMAFQDDSGLWGFVDQNGNVVLQPQFCAAKSFSGGLAAVYDGETWGFIREDGTVVIDYQFVDVSYFSQSGVCFVSKVDGTFYTITLRFP